MFRQPILVGELVTFLASVNCVGRSSMEVGIKVVAEDIRIRSVRHVNSCFFTMVAVNDDGQPVELPRLKLLTPEDRCRHAAAVHHKAMRATSVM